MVMWIRTSRLSIKKSLSAGGRARGTSTPERGILGALGVQGSGFRVQGSGFRVQGSGFRAQPEIRITKHYSRKAERSTLDLKHLQVARTRASLTWTSQRHILARNRSDD
jgi:hypothetical protein